MQAHSIGIIGGADGPTAIFVTGNPLPGILLLAAAGLALGLLIGWYFRKRK